MQVPQNRVPVRVRVHRVFSCILWILLSDHLINHHEEEARVIARCSALFSSHCVYRVTPKVCGWQTLATRCLKPYLEEARAQQLYSLHLSTVRALNSVLYGIFLLWVFCTEVLAPQAFEQQLKASWGIHCCVLVDPDTRNWIWIRAKYRYYFGSRIRLSWAKNCKNLTWNKWSFLQLKTKSFRFDFCSGDLRRQLEELEELNYAVSSKIPCSKNNSFLSGILHMDHEGRSFTILTYYKDIKSKCRHLKNWPVKGLCGRCLSEFIDWRYSKSWWYRYFRGSFVTFCPSNLLWFICPPPPSLCEKV